MDPLFQALNQKALTTSIADKAPKPAADRSTSFSNMLQTDHASETQALSHFVDNLFGDMRRGPQMQTYSANDISVNLNREYEVVQGPGFQGIGDYISQISKSKRNIDFMMERIVNGDRLTQEQLLSFQHVFQDYALNVEMTSKVVEQVNRAIMQPWQMQV